MNSMNKIRLLFGKRKYKIGFLLDNVKRCVMLKANDCKDSIKKIQELFPGKIKIISVCQV